MVTENVGVVGVITVEGGGGELRGEGQGHSVAEDRVCLKGGASQEDVGTCVCVSSAGARSWPPSPRSRSLGDASLVSEGTACFVVYVSLW